MKEKIKFATNESILPPEYIGSKLAGKRAVSDGWQIPLLPDYDTFVSVSSPWTAVELNGSRQINLQPYGVMDWRAQGNGNSPTNLGD